MAKLVLTPFRTPQEEWAHYETLVDAAAEAARARIITAAPGQSMTYEAKYQEAARYPNGTSFPWLEAEAQELGMSVAAVAQSVLQAREKWQQIGIEIERKRLGAKASIRNASSTSDRERILRNLRFLPPE